LPARFPMTGTGRQLGGEKEKKGGSEKKKGGTEGISAQMPVA